MEVVVYLSDFCHSITGSNQFVHFPMVKSNVISGLNCNGFKLGYKNLY